MSDLIVVLLMVKNEASAMKNTLLPLIQGGISNFLVLDTGSTDGTIEITRQIFDDSKVNGIIEQKPFVDFATSRNHLLEFAEKYFSHIPFFFMLDADWTVQNVPKLLEFCSKYQAAKDSVYAIHVQTKSIHFLSPRLFRSDANIRYIGTVHENPDQSASEIFVDYDVVCIVNSDTRHTRKSSARYQSDLTLLFKELKKNPADHHLLFYIGQTYECLGNLKDAYKYYIKCSVVNGKREIRSVVYFRLGYLTEHLGQVDSKYTWDLAMDYYLKAFAVCTSRVEGLIAIASHYIGIMPQISFVFLTYACAAAIPQDHGPVPLELYQFVRHDLMSKAAALMAKYDIAIEATKSALKHMPDNQNLLTALSAYENAFARLQNNPMPTNNLQVPSKQPDQMSPMLQ